MFRSTKFDYKKPHKSATEHFLFLRVVPFYLIPKKKTKKFYKANKEKFDTAYNFLKLVSEFKIQTCYCRIFNLKVCESYGVARPYMMYIAYDPRTNMQRFRDA